MHTGQEGHFEENWGQKGKDFSSHPGQGQARYRNQGPACLDLIPNLTLCCLVIKARMLGRTGEGKAAGSGEMEKVGIDLRLIPKTSPQERGREGRGRTGSNWL